MQEIIYGYHAIEEALKKGFSNELLLVSGKSKRVIELRELAGKKGCAVKVSDTANLDKVSGGADHRGAVLLVSRKEEKRSTAGRIDFASQMEYLAGKEGDSLVLLLDGITDPQNLGALMRSADQFAVDLVVMPERRSAGDSATVRKVSAGASLHVPKVSVPNLVRAMESLKEAGFWIYGADMEGEKSWNIKLKGKVALVLGAEGRGLGRLVSERCDGIISIPSRGHIDSLNVSVAGGILLYECRRQMWK